MVVCDLGSLLPPELGHGVMFPCQEPVVTVGPSTPPGDPQVPVLRGTQGPEVAEVGRWWHVPGCSISIEVSPELVVTWPLTLVAACPKSC